MKEVKRLAIFAGYDKDNIIDDYVVYYIKELKKIADIIYVSDCDMLDSELEKISPYCIHIINGKHCEYDFGSYKRGFWYARVTKLIFNYDYLLFCNDSVYGPFYDLKKIVESMEKKDLDAWSMFDCFFDHINVEHLQSYFIEMKKNIFLSEKFTYFMYLVTKENSKDNVLMKYEMGLTMLFKDNNYKIGGYFDSSSIETDGDTNLPFHKAEELIKKGFPFFKRSIVSSEHWLKTFNFTADNLKNIKEVIKDSYNINLMKNNIERVLNIDFETLLPILEDNQENEIKNENKGFHLFNIESNEKYDIIYIFGIKITIKK